MKPSDKVTILFSFFLLFLVTINYDKVPAFKNLALVYASIIFLQFCLTRLITVNPILAFSRDILFPVVSVFIIFDSLEGIVHNINPQDIDPLLIRLDYSLFNAYPGLLIEPIESPILTDILEMAYSTYYFLPITFGVLLKLKGDKEGFERSLFLVLLCFYLSYLGYILLPALGPRYTMNHLYSDELKGLFFYEHINGILNKLEGIKRDAFPSGHTAIALTVLVLAYKFHKGFFYVAFPIVILLIFSTVYGRYHYVVDVIGGVLLTILTIFVGDRIYESKKKEGPHY